MFQYFGKPTFLIVDVEVIAFKKIIGNVNILPAILIDIADGNPKPKPNDAAVDACLCTDVDKFFAIIAEKFVSTQWIAGIAHLFAQVETADGLEGIVEQVKIEVAVFVVVKKGRMGRVAGVSNAVLLGHFFKSAVFLVDVQLIFAVITFDLARVANVDVQPTVAIDVGHTYPGRPGAFATHLGFFRNVFKLPIAPIEVQAILIHIGGKVDVDQAIVVDIPQCDPSTIVEIAVGINIEFLIEFQLIDKFNTRNRTGHFRKQRLGIHFRGLF